VVTASRFESIPEPLRGSVDTVIEAPALRHRIEDVLPLASAFAAGGRQRPIDFAPAAMRALRAYHWPGNVAQLREVARSAASRADVIDARHLPPEVFTSERAPLSRLEVVERDEIVRCLTEPGVSVQQAAQKLGIGRATIYRKMAHYGISVPGR
jgi:sigma-54 dependent transcriptional regulator, acetoin dehydrogenase operon transcriptional activator AcoR